MAALIELTEAQAWAENTKLTLAGFDTKLLEQTQALVLARIATAYPSEVPTWISPVTTPNLIRTIISMLYVSWYIDKVGSMQSDDLNRYAGRLAAVVEANILGIIDGTIDIIEVPGDTGINITVGFYPTDASSAMEPTEDDMSLGGSSFSMGKSF